MFYVTTCDGTKIAVYDYNPFGKKTVFLVHGWPLSHKIYDYQLECLIHAGYRVVLLDLRGFGASDNPASGYCYDTMSADIYDVVCEMNLTHFSLVGFSMGGGIALRYIRKFSGYGVDKLILLSAAAPCWTQRKGFPYGLTKQYVDELICLARTDRPQLAKNFSGQLFASPQTCEVINWFKDIALSASQIGTVKACIALRDEDGREDLSNVHVPTYIIHGAKDQVVSNDLAKIQHKCIEGSILYNLKNSGHGIMYDELEKFNQVFMEVINH